MWDSVLDLPLVLWLIGIVAFSPITSAEMYESTAKMAAVIKYEDILMKQATLYVNREKKRLNDITA